jgi:hypothetical protein
LRSSSDNLFIALTDSTRTEAADWRDNLTVHRAVLAGIGHSQIQNRLPDRQPISVQMRAIKRIGFCLIGIAFLVGTEVRASIPADIVPFLKDDGRNLSPNMGIIAPVDHALHDSSENGRVAIDFTSIPKTIPNLLVHCFGALCSEIQKFIIKTGIPRRGSKWVGDPRGLSDLSVAEVKMSDCNIQRAGLYLAISTSVKSPVRNSRVRLRIPSAQKSE